eukprot:1138600-Pelagomonas_calceolata.AAC.14
MLGNSQYAIEKGCWIKADTNLKSLQGKAKLRGQKIEKQGKGKQGKGLRGARMDMLPSFRILGFILHIHWANRDGGLGAAGHGTAQGRSAQSC